jgi:hypothetical protein
MKRLLHGDERHDSSSSFVEQQCAFLSKEALPSIAE